MNALSIRLLSASALVVLMVGGMAQAVTVTLTYEDPCSVMGALNNDDGDVFSQVAASHGGPAKPYISTMFPGGGHSHIRRAIAEFALEPMRDVSVDPDAVVVATLRFYFDDVIFPDSSSEPFTTQDFTLELYTETANGVLDGVDANEADATVGGEGPDDWASTVVQSWRFLAGEVADLPVGQEIVGMFGPDELFPAKFGDDELAIYGMIGFEVDVTDFLCAVINDPNVSYLGFRWICNSEGGYWTSMDPDGYLPQLSVEMVADEPLTFKLQSTDAGEVTGSHSGRPYHIFDDADDEAIYLSVSEWQGGHFPDSAVTWPIADGIIDWDVFFDPNGASERPEAATYDAVGNTLYVYWNTTAEDYVLIADENDVPEACEKLTAAVGSSDVEDICLETGHIGIYVSSRCQREFAPKIAQWLKERDGVGKKRTGSAKKTAKRSASGKTRRRPLSAK